MIQYPMLEFAALPNTGASWFLHAMSVCGYRYPVPLQAYTPFEGDTDLPRVTLVRHPCQWILAMYRSGCMKGWSTERKREEFLAQNPTFEQYVANVYSSRCSVYFILFAEYKSDIVLRVEDFPTSFLVIAKSLKLLRNLSSIDREVLQNPIRSEDIPPDGWDQDTWRRILSSEKEMATEFDYV
jgi:hypothetical protein